MTTLAIKPTRVNCGNYNYDGAGLLDWCTIQFGKPGTQKGKRWFYRIGWYSGDGFKQKLTLFFRNSEDAVLFTLLKL